ncbi:hypothetical protein EWM64_g834 [Hericium alpestre]|uniref:Sister chromatid cohesion protein n=1 Tax=Hericium alpestre TaxID=135208 RepID=A0A4Z0AB16_9AGAM|nr:hypothetical protein EWM64_g834 [Hericium alpestre]
MIRKLTKHVAQAARPIKRLRGHGGLPSTPAKTKVKPENIADIDASTVSRILKVLERTVRAGEDLDPFSNKLHLGSTGTRSVTSSPVKKRNTKGAKRQDVPSSRRSKSQTPRDDEKDTEGRPEGVPPSSEGVRDLNLEELTCQLDVARNSILAADCSIAILSSDRLSKQVYSEELITTCLAAIKNQLNRIIYPFIEFSPAMPQADPFLLFLAQGGHQSQNHRRQLGEIFQSLSSVLPRINDLISTDAVTMSDAVVIQAVYIAIGPFFVLDSGEEERGKAKKDNLVLNTFGQSAMRGLRLNALSLIRSIFAHHEEQRSWIIEEILTSLIKLSETKQKAGQFRLRDGRSIRTVSALLLQLVQTSAHGIRDEARRLSKARQQLLGAQRQEGPSNATPQAFLNEKDTEEIQLYLSGLESATKAAKTIIVFLTQRSGKGKATKNSNEAEYRNILDNLISDVLAVLFWPEWPAASLLLSIICKFMVASLDDIKHTTHNAKDNDNNAARNIALDHLGIIAARLRGSMLKFQGNGESALRPLDEVLPSANLKQLSRLIQAHHDVSVHLSKRSSEDQAYDSARDLTAVTWGQELAIALKQCDVVLDDTQRGFNSISADQPRLLLFGSKLKNALRDVWKEAGVDVFDLGSESEVTLILHALDAPPVFMRTKALRALGQIVTSDASILSAPNVRRGIESHLLDSSPAVRDAAVELIGKYIIDSPEVAGDYYRKIADRIADTGLGVRKRVIKLLKSVYGISDDFERRVDICSRLVLRMYDEDEGVRDLAVKAIEELWFTSSPIGTSIQRQQEAVVATVPGDKTQLLAKVAVIMSVSGSFRERQSPLEDVLHKLMTGKEDAEASSLHERYSEICEVLIDGLVDASDLPGFTVINCVRTIYLFTSAYPAILTGAHASTLLPYLKNASTPDEQTTSDYLLKTFRVSIPQMPKTAAKFGAELQTALQPMILKPSAAGGTSALQETVACILAIAELVADLDDVTKGSITEHVYTSLLALYQGYTEPVLRDRILQCLGFLFRAQPTLMTVESSAMIMDAIFASSQEESRARLLKVMQEFLVSEASKHSVKTQQGNPGATDLDMEELVGNTDGFADSGVSSAIVQRYLDPILQAVLSQHSQTQSAAIDILSFTIKQGLAHPLQSFPVVIALETSPSPTLSSRANALHAILHNKHSSLLNSRYVISARASFEYQKKLGTGPIQGYNVSKNNPTALLQQWYTLVREKRPSRLDFLRSLLRVFELKSDHACTQDDVEFTRYMAENFATLDYKTQEEVLVVAKSLTTVLSTVGMHLIESLSPSHLLAQLHAPLHPQQLPNGDQEMHGVEVPQQRQVQSPDIWANEHVAQSPEKMPLLRSSIVVAIVMLLRAYLKATYGITEDKCLKWVIGKKNAQGDRAAIRRHSNPLTWERLPFAVRPLLTTEDMAAQRDTFLQVWTDDGVSGEPEEDFEEHN